MLTSTKNPRIQQIRKLQNSARTRRESRRFVIEGVRLAEEVINAGWEPEFVLYTEDLQSRGQELITAFSNHGTEVIPVASHVMQAASDTRTPQGILAMIPWRVEKLPTKADFFLVVDGIRDPGNLGTILRTALAAGVDAVLIPPGSTDFTAPKVLRAGMGAHFRLTIHSIDWVEIGKLSEDSKMKAFLADSGGGFSYTQADFKSPLILIIGGEAAGAGWEAQQLATQRIHIPMPGQTESLNAAVASAILMFEVTRQRKA